jgi:squalene-hopene/tetraprenyl-beta-curcumene cyclase
MALDPNRLSAAYRTALSVLLAERHSEGYWTGELSTSALSTATAVSALALVGKRSSSSEKHAPLVAGGLAWLADHQNADGGWGDTVKSLSNISTTMLGRAALHLADGTQTYADCLQRAEAYLQEHCGQTPAQQAEAVRARYGKDRTFAVPILTTCALAGLVDWGEVTPLPFELACFPQSWFRFLKLPVVSYALPALIAVGQAVYHHRRPRNPATRLIRQGAIGKSLRVLQTIQPSSGGFLEAVPLTSFVTLSLASIGQADHPVARKAVGFLERAVRSDGSWPIDSNLATWVTTLAINALHAAGELQVRGKGPGIGGQEEVRDWLLKQQYTERHLYTGADPGGWAWTDLPGGVPDGDDTPGALLALRHLTAVGGQDCAAQVRAGLRWLCRLQNGDGGWPTFCRGWGHLPFDRSGTDLTAHALRALAVWCQGPESGVRGQGLGVSPDVASRSADSWPLTPISEAIAAGFEFLARSQRPDGSWAALWFGNQYARGEENPTYGTARVLAAYRDLDKMDTEPAHRGVAWLLAAQNSDGGWGGAAGVASSIEETALAVEALQGALTPEPRAAVNKGLACLVEQVEAGGLRQPTPIGFYFAKLWYFEKLYPIIFTVAALGRAVHSCCETHL